MTVTDLAVYFVECFIVLPALVKLLTDSYACEMFFVYFLI